LLSDGDLSRAKLPLALKDISHVVLTDHIQNRNRKSSNET
jgi:hypothetical protein